MVLLLTCCETVYHSSDSLTYIYTYMHAYIHIGTLHQAVLANDTPKGDGEEAEKAAATAPQQLPTPYTEVAARARAVARSVLPLL